MSPLISHVKVLCNTYVYSNYHNMLMVIFFFFTKASNKKKRHGHDNIYCCTPYSFKKFLEKVLVKQCGLVPDEPPRKQKTYFEINDQSEVSIMIHRLLFYSLYISVLYCYYYGYNIQFIFIF